MDTQTTSVGPWQPLSLGGVAGFASASFRRLWLIQSIAALAVAVAVVWFFRTGWEPALEEAIDQLPDSGQIRHGQLEWAGPSPARLCERDFLTIVVDLADSGETGLIADL